MRIMHCWHHNSSISSVDELLSTTNSTHKRNVKRLVFVLCVDKLDKTTSTADFEDRLSG